MPDINDGTIRSINVAHGTITITDGATANVVFNIDGTTVRFQQAGRGMIDPVNDIDRGTLPTTIREGPEQPGMLEFEARNTIGAAGSGELIDLLEEAGASGLKKSFTVALDIPDYQGATSGLNIDVVNAVFDNPFALNAAAEEDRVPCRMVFTKAATLTEGAL